MERFYPRTNGTTNNGYNNFGETTGGYNNFYNEYDDYADDYNSYTKEYTGGYSFNQNNNPSNDIPSDNGNNGNGNDDSKDNCHITNTATVQGYMDPWGSGTPTLVTGEDSVTLGCIMADLEKTADRDNVNAGDRIRYTITFRNMSDREMYNVKITDEISAYLNVIASSINPAPRPGETLAEGINIGRVPAGSQRSLTFTATVTDDVMEDIVNRAFADFNFRDNSGQQQSASTPVTSLTTAVESAGITVTKTADRSYVTADGEQVEFTITVTNKSARGVSDLVITDNLPENLVYVENTTSVNGANPINADPTGGIYIGELNGGNKVTVRFAAAVKL